MMKRIEIWQEWDKCYMDVEKPNFPQYLSRHRALCLQMPNLNEFHAFWGFLRGLHPNYEEYVRPKNPRTLDEAVELAQIYDDVQRKKKGKRSLSSDSFSGPSSGYKKTFFKKKDQKETNLNGNKCFKSPSGLASKSNSGSKGKFLSCKD